MFRFRGLRLQSLAGWLWADLMLGMFAIFMVANTVGPKPVPPSPSPSSSATVTVTATATARITASPSPSPGVNREPVSITVAVNGPLLLNGSGQAVSDEQDRILRETLRQLTDRFGAAVAKKKVALVLAFGKHAVGDLGRRIAEIGTAKFTTGIFQGANLLSYIFLVSGDPGSAIQLDVYFYYD